MQTYSLNVARTLLVSRCDLPIRFREPEATYLPFVGATGSSSETVDIEIHGLDPGDIPREPEFTKVFDTHESWSLHRRGDDLALVFELRDHRHPPLWIARFDRNATKARVLLGDRIFKPDDPHALVNHPMSYPLDQLLLIYALAGREGILFHSAGARIAGRGYLFAGKSGAGKTTLARSLSARNNIEVLSDDRVVVRKIDDTFRLFGTPWAGEGGFARNESMVLSGIFFLHQADDDALVPMTPQRALDEMLPVVSIPWYDRNVFNPLLDLSEKIVTSIPAFELRFTTTGRVVDLVEELAES